MPAKLPVDPSTINAEHEAVRLAIVQRIEQYKKENHIKKQKTLADICGISAPALSYLMQGHWTKFHTRVILSVVHTVFPLHEREEWSAKLTLICLSYRKPRCQTADDIAALIEQEQAAVPSAEHHQE